MLPSRVGNIRPGGGSKGSFLDLIHWNVTQWGDPVQDLLSKTKCGIVACCETHLRDHKFVSDRLSRSGWAGVWGSASDGPAALRLREVAGSDPQGGSSFDPVAQAGDAAGPGELGRSTSGGVCLLWRKHLHVTPIHQSLWQCISCVHFSRVIGVMLRLRGLWLLILEIYLWTGEGMSARNSEILGEVTELIRVAHCPAILMGDFRCHTKRSLAQHGSDSVILLP